MGLISDLARQISVTLDVTVAEKYVLVAICKNPPLVSKIACGGDPETVLNTNLSAITSTVRGIVAPPDVVAPAVSSGSLDAIYASVVESVQAMSSTFDMGKMKDYMAKHKDMEQKLQELYSTSYDEALTYMRGQIPVIAMEVLTGG